ncbi:MAG: sialidase family protein, partial [Acidimicrobiia bacterium]
MSPRTRRLIVVLAVGTLVAVIVWRVPSSGPYPIVTAQQVGPSSSATDAGAEGEHHTLDGEVQEAADIARARVQAFDAAREADLLGRTGPADPVPNPGWTTEHVWNANQDDWEPTIAADPSAPYVYTLTTRYTGPARCPACPSPSIVFRASSDGGRSWTNDSFLCVCKSVDHGQYDPQIATDAHGTIYAAWLEGYQPGVSFSKSTDHGATWSKPVSMPSAWSDKPWLAVSPSGQDVYIAYNGPSHGDSFVGVSHDGGASFVAKKVTDGNRYFFAGGAWVSSDGQHVAFAESDFDQDYAGQIHSDAVVSGDGG